MDGPIFNSHFSILRMIFKIWIYVTFSTGFILQKEVSGCHSEFISCAGDPLFFNLIFKTGPEEDKVLIEKDNVEYDSYPLSPKAVKQRAFKEKS